MAALLYVLSVAPGCDGTVSQGQDTRPWDLGQAADSAADVSRIPDAGGDNNATGDLNTSDLSATDLYTPDSEIPDLLQPDTAPPVPPYKEARGLIHMHSIYSHDACDGKGFTGTTPNLTCLKQLRAAICAGKFDFMMLTDHPSNMKSYTMKEDLLYDAAAGDQLVMQAGAPIANFMACSGGHKALLSVGFESKHMMPLGLHSLPATNDLYDGISDTTPMATLQKQVKGLKALGAVVSMVHTEETDISTKTIVDGGFDTMEWYNIHANFSALLGSDLLTVDLKNIPALIKLLNKLLGMLPFLSGTVGGPHADLYFLVVLDSLPLEGFTKWKQAQNSRLITGILGSDIHQNVSVDISMCAGLLKPACAVALGLAEVALGFSLPAAIKSLILSGGNIMLTDGDRVDSYGRLSRWLENRLLVKKVELEALHDALRSGRAYGVFTIFGDPHAFSYTGQQGTKVLQMGSKAKGPVTLQVSAPDRPAHQGVGGAPFTALDALKAEVTTRLLRIDKTGTVTVQTSTTLGAKITHTVSTPGAYYVEVTIKPKHLTQALATSHSLANKEYLWVISNPIFVTN